MKLKRLTKEKIQRKLRRYAVKWLGLYVYLSYWHYKCNQPVANPDTSGFYLAARPNPGAGIGHQMANWIAGYWYARQLGLKFANTPFSTPKWDDFLGFGADEIQMSSLKRNGWKVRHIPVFHEGNQQEIDLVKKIMATYSGQKVVFLCEQDQYYRDQYGVIDDIRRKFYDNPVRKTEHLRYDNTHYNIAIHVRRGDILADPSNPSLRRRYLSNDYFEKVLREVLAHVKTEKPVHVYFFSQGKPEEYPEFASFPNLHWCMDMNAQESFLHMVYADLLITSKSSFSYKPALLNKGIKVCPREFWHNYPQSPDWVMVENNGTVRWK